MDATVPGLGWPLFGALEVLWVLVLSVYILLERRSPVATLAWIFGLALLPGIGFLVYLVFGPRRLARKRRRRALARSLIDSKEGLRWIRESRTTIARGAEAGEPAHALAELAVRAGEPPPWHCESVTLFFRGSEAYEAILEAIESAKHHVHLSYYIFEEGVVARRILEALARRARDGIEVRLLVDSLGSRSLSDALVAGLVAAGGEVAWFNRLRFARFGPPLLNFRSHRKIVCVDGEIGFTGGMNVQDGHDESVVGERAWRDTHLRIVGDAVAALELVFLEDWAFATGRSPSGEPYVQAPSGRGAQKVQIVSSGPDVDAKFAIHMQFFAAIASARERVLLTTPYFVPDEATTMALCTAARRGVDVRILVPSDGDHPFVSAAGRAYFPMLLEAGVRIFGYGPRFLHAKTLVVDHHYSAVGTANFDNRSFRLNFEVIAVLFDPATAGELAAVFDADLAHATEYTRSGLKRRGVGAHLYESVAKLFSPVL